MMRYYAFLVVEFMAAWISDMGACQHCFHPTALCRSTYSILVSADRQNKSEAVEHTRCKDVVLQFSPLFLQLSPPS